MQISSIKNINFNGKIAYDDSVSSERRKYIRHHLTDDIFQSSDVFLNNPRLEKYELNKLLSSLAKKEEIKKNELSKIDSKKMEGLDLYNIEPIYGTSHYKGSTSELTPKALKTLKEAGVKGVISFNEFSFHPMEVRQADLDAYQFPVGNGFWWNNPAFKSKEDIIEENEKIHYCNSKKSKDEIIQEKLQTWEFKKRQFIDKFTRYIQEMQKPNRYIGCAWGVDRTNDMLALNYLFNPQVKDSHPYYLRCADDRVPKIINLYNNLTSDDKEKMGWNVEFDKNFMKRLKCFLPEVEI